VNSTLEPNGLSRNNGKRPDGMTLVLWIKGQPLVWDVTVVDTLADSYVLKSSEVSAFAAEMACKRKHSKYSSIISSNYVFKGLAFETLGPWCKESGDSKSKKFLFERISLAIQRGNAASKYYKTKMLCNYVINIMFFISFQYLSGQLVETDVKSDSCF
jgi:hypothetical protein